MNDRPRKRPPVPRERSQAEPLPSATWRLVITPPLDGATNMAIDEAIAESVAAGLSRPTLRFYTWNPPCLSLGYAQPPETADAARCAQFGWEMVRRATGGRAVLHIDELTYSVCAPDDEPRVAGGVLESYRRLSAGLVRGLRRLGLDPERAQPYHGDAGAAGPACFDGPSDYEITIGGRKLLGSAQRRMRGVVLQHGALPLHGDVTRICDALALEPGARMALRNRLRYRAVSLAEALGVAALDAQRVAQALADGFAEALALTWEAAELSAHEVERAAAVRAARYAHPDWTARPDRLGRPLPDL